MNDTELLRQYAEHGSAEAFRELVVRHTNLVYACARQRLHDDHAAQDVTQAAFLALAQQAQHLSLRASLSTWLYGVTRHLCRNHLRREQRRQEREMRAFADQPSTDPGPIHTVWEELEPHLAGALDALSGADREVVLLRYYRQASHRQIAEQLRISEDAAEKRVSRALEKLRGLFARKGVAVSVTALAGLLTANISTAAPAGLAATAASAALASGGSLAWITTGGIAIMSTKLKIAAVAAVVCLLAGGTGLYVWQANPGPSATPNQRPLSVKATTLRQLPTPPVNPSATTSKTITTTAPMAPLFATFKEYHTAYWNIMLIGDDAKRLAAIRQRLGMNISDEVYRHALAAHGNRANYWKLMDEILLAWLTASPQDVFIWTQRFPGEVRRQLDLDSLTKWLTLDREAAVAFAREHLSPDLLADAERRRDSLEEDPLRKLADSGEFAELIRLAKSMKGDTSPDEGLWRAVGLWAEKDPRAAAEYALSITKDPTVIHTALTTWTDTDPDAALAWAKTLADEQDRNAALAKILPGWARKHPDQPVDIGFLPKQMQVKVSAEIAAEWARHNPTRAMEYARSLEDAEERRILAAHVANVWRRLDTEALTAWALEMPADDLRQVGLREAAELIADRGDLAKAGTLLNNLPDPARQYAIQSLISSSLLSNPKAALQLADGLPQVGWQDVKGWVMQCSQQPPEVRDALRVWIEQAHTTGRIGYFKWQPGLMEKRVDPATGTSRFEEVLPRNADPAAVADYNRQRAESSYRQIINEFDRAATNAGK